MMLKMKIFHFHHSTPLHFHFIYSSSVMIDGEVTDAMAKLPVASYGRLVGSCQRSKKHSCQSEHQLTWFFTFVSNASAGPAAAGF